MSPASDLKKLSNLRCAKCDSSQNIELHHLGGRNHVAWITIPLCRDHHIRLTVAIRQAGINMRHTSDREERHKRARLTALLFIWFLDEAGTTNR
jgi:hypothetical protein